MSIAFVSNLKNLILFLEAPWSPQERIYVFEGGVWHKEATPTCSPKNNGPNDVIVDHVSRDGQTISPLKRSSPNDEDGLQSILPQTKLLKEDSPPTEQ